MKKILFLFTLILLLLTDIQAQNRSRKRGVESLTGGKQVIQISGGYNFMFFNPTGLNNVLSDYNNQLTESQKFTPFNVLQGFSGALTYYGKYEDCKHRRLTSYFIEVGYTGGSQNITGKQYNSPLNSSMQFDIQNHSTHFRGGFMPSLGVIDIGLAGGIDVGLSSLYQNTDNKGKVLLDNNINIGASVSMPIYINFGKYSVFSLGVRPFYQYQFTKNNASKLYEFLNNRTLNPEEIQKFDYHLHNYGVELHLCFMLKRLNYY